jgi:carboxymethylenebutenolidase
MSKTSLPFSVSCAAAVAAMSLLAGSAGAQDWAKAQLEKSSRHGEYVTIPEANGRKLQAFVVYPEVKGKAPVVVLIHEIFGQSDWAKLMADELAAKGYIVVEPDLLSGFGAPAGAMAAMPGMDMTDHTHPAPASGAPTGAAFVAATPGGTAAFPDQGSVTKAVSALDPAIVTADLDAAADYGKKLPAANGKLAVAGFCWGGGKTFAFATHRADLSAAFVFYGPPPKADAMAAIKAPVYGFYAGNDARIDATIPQATTDMKVAGKTYEPVTYEGAGHGFMRAGQAPDASPENKKAWDEGFARLLKGLKEMK